MTDHSSDVEPGFERREDPDFALVQTYREVLEAQNPEAVPDVLSEAAVEITRLLEPLALSDKLTSFYLQGTVMGLVFEIDQHDEREEE